MARARLRTAAIFCTLWACSLSTVHAAAPTVGDLLVKGSDQISMFNWDNAYDLYSEALAKAEAAGEKTTSEDVQQALFGKAVAAHHKSPPSPEALAEAAALY